MAMHDFTALVRSLKDFLPDFLILKLAQHHNILQRQRKVDLVCFVWTIILGSCHQRSLSALARCYEQTTGCLLDRSAFYRRFTLNLARLFEDLFSYCAGAKVHSSLGAFKEILAMDATLIRLWQHLADKFPSVNDGQAHAKLQLVINVCDMTPNQLKLSDGKSHELKQWKSLGPWLKDRLLLVDLGYYCFWFLHRVDAHGGYFLSRVKTNCTLLILEDVDSGPGRRVNVCGRTLKDALKLLKRQRFEFIVQVPVKLRSKRQIEYKWRVIGHLNEETGKYHIYMTNAPSTLIPSQDVTKLYALRWQIELLFKGLKQTCGLNRLPSSKPEVVKVLILASLLFVLMSGWLRQRLFGVHKIEQAPMQRVLKIVAQWAQSMLMAICKMSDYFKSHDALTLLKRQCRDPNLFRERAFGISPIADFSP